MSLSTPLPPKIAPGVCRNRSGLGQAEFIALVASFMALNALAIDIMLPAMQQIGSALGVESRNDAQRIVVVYLLGFGFPQLILGPLSDRIGRKPILYFALIGYLIAAIGCMFAQSFGQLLVWRFLQGVAASGTRVMAVSIVRDIFAGRGMARIMSFVMTVFMAVPILAPALGQVVVQTAEASGVPESGGAIASWRLIFGVLALASLGLLSWTFFRLKETLEEENRSDFRPARIFGNFRMVLSTRVTVGYMLASGVIFAALFSFIAASEQIFRDVFEVGDSFVLWFAGIAAVLSVANLTNANLVERIGMRRLSHGALVIFTVSSALLYVLMTTVGETLWLFFPLFSLAFACFGLIGANFNALAMEPLGKIAGTGSAVHGFLTSAMAGALGGWIGAQYDGTVLPILAGYVALGLICLTIVTITERNQLFSSR